jgi:uncharacterized damage-inducible protein DinB
MPELDALLASLRAADAEYDAAFERLAPGDRERRPAPDRWSVAEVTEHVAIVDRAIAGQFATAVADARAAGLTADAEDPAAVFSIDEAQLLDRTVRLTAGEASRPTGALDAAAARAALIEARGALEAVVASAQGLALSRIVRPSRRSGPLNFAQWMAFAAVHERRHAAQVAEIASALASA